MASEPPRPDRGRSRVAREEFQTSGGSAENRFDHTATKSKLLSALRAAGRDPFQRTVSPNQSGAPGTAGSEVSRDRGGPRDAVARAQTTGAKDYTGEGPKGAQHVDPLVAAVMRVAQQKSQRGTLLRSGTDAAAAFVDTQPPMGAEEGEGRGPPAMSLMLRSEEAPSARQWVRKMSSRGRVGLPGGPPAPSPADASAFEGSAARLSMAGHAAPAPAPDSPRAPRDARKSFARSAFASRQAGPDMEFEPSPLRWTAEDDVLGALVRLENDDAESSVAEPSLGCGPLDDYALVARAKFLTEATAIRYDNPIALIAVSVGLFFSTAFWHYDIGLHHCRPGTGFMDLFAKVLPIPGCLSSQAVSLTTLALLALTALLQAFAFVTDREWDLAFVVAYAQALSAMILVPLSDILVAARDELSWSQVICLSLGLGIIRGMVSACSNTTRLAVAVFSAAAVADVAAKTALWPHADPATLPAAAAVAAVLAVIAGLFSRGVLNAGGIASFQCWSAALARRAAQSPGPSFAEAYMMVEGRILAPLSALGLYLRGFWHILTFRGLLVYAASWVVSVAGAVAAFVVLATGRRIDLHPAWALAGIAWWAATRKTAMDAIRFRDAVIQNIVPKEVADVLIRHARPSLAVDTGNACSVPWKPKERTKPAPHVEATERGSQEGGDNSSPNGSKDGARPTVRAFTSRALDRSASSHRPTATTTLPGDSERSLNANALARTGPPATGMECPVAARALSPHASRQQSLRAADGAALSEPEMSPLSPTGSWRRISTEGGTASRELSASAPRTPLSGTRRRDPSEVDTAVEPRQGSFLGKNASRRWKRTNTRLHLNGAPGPAPLLYFKEYDDVTMIFSDVVSYTTMSSTSRPIDVLSMLHSYFSKLDSLVEALGAYKYETVGDAYVVAVNLTRPQRDHQLLALRIAMAMVTQASQIEKADRTGPIEIRVGIHTGPVAGGIIGVKRTLLTLCGDTLNVAARMESNSRPAHIRMTATTALALPADIQEHLTFETLDIKGKGPMDTAILYGMDTNVAGLLTTNLSSLTSRPDGVRTPIKEHPAPIRED